MVFTANVGTVTKSGLRHMDVTRDEDRAHMAGSAISKYAGTSRWDEILEVVGYVRRGPWEYSPAGMPDTWTAPCDRITVRRDES